MATLAQAVAFAAEVHARQRRNGTTIPYISHLMAVSSLVMEHGGDEEQAIAGLLHDTLEDGGPQHAAPILAQFGPRVLRIVQGCTDSMPDAQGHKPAWRTRKLAYLDHLAHTTDEVLLVAACDKLHNARAILLDLRQRGPTLFDRFTADKDGVLWYYDQLQAIISPRAPLALGAELHRTVQAILLEA